MKFRTDINGLRAIAVLVVVLFHFSPEKLPGGFVGVDIFFVISGYLMTSIIFRGFENNNFSFWKFIINRAKRIAPALLTTVFIILVLGYATLGSDAYKMLASHARDSLLFISNIAYKNESGYFDVSSNTKFLLHTWSLSVEWQFYMVYPLILLSLKRFISIAALKIVVVILLAISLVASVFVTKYNPETAYFMFYTRAWEMMFGGMAFLYPLKASFSNRARFTMELIGLSIISISALKINTQTPWPGYMAMLPVVGTYICIVANNKNTILSGYIIEKIGLWSYSIYLVHWPILVFDLLLGWELSFKKYIVAVFILSFISYQLIEKRRQYKWGLLVSFVISLVITSYIYNTNGVSKRFNIPPNIHLSVSQATKDWQERKWIEHGLSDGNPIEYVFFGDSHMAQYEPYFKHANLPSAFLYSGECLSTINYYSNWESCKNLYKLATDTKNTTLVIANYWSNSLKDWRVVKTDKKMGLNLQEFIDIFESELILMKDKMHFDKIILIGEHNRFQGADPWTCPQKLYSQTLYEQYININKNECNSIVPMNMRTKEINDKLKKLSINHDWLYFINPTDPVCEDDQCIQIKDTLILHADKSHLSIVGAELIGGYIFDEIKKIE